MTRVAAVDCGTNSIRLLICDLDGESKTDLVREMRVVRLGAGVDRTGRFDEAALVRTFAACEEYAALVRAHEVERIRFCATSATRDAGNAQVFHDGVRERLGVRPEVVSGDEEARLSFAGAVRELGEVDEPVLVVDLGGGSTELVLGRGAAVEHAVSLDVGSVRMTERHLHGDPPTTAQVASARADVDEALGSAALDLASARTFVGVAGSITTVAAHALDLPGYDSRALHHARILLPRLLASCEAMEHASVAERTAMPFMHPGRADVIGGGAVVLERVARLVGADAMVVSEHDILDGIAWSCS